ncbi:MAG: NUDIX domain-containing protein [Lachnospiraceae bacterium]|nr:NUDIX domain-containing protein [Lachnospiraceae bacterium]
MLNTTLVHIEKDGAYLMMHRVKKKNDINKDKWIGVGGKFLENETPEECAIRETYEETGLTLTDYRLRAVVTFLSDEYEGEYMYIFTATGYTGEIGECNEGTLEWVDKSKVCDLPIWEGDKLFFEELNRDRGFFTMKLRYEGEKLVETDFKLYN